MAGYGTPLLATSCHTLQACIASFCYGLLPLVYARAPPMQAYMVMESITLFSAWLVSATQTVLLLYVTVEITHM